MVITSHKPEQAGYIYVHRGDFTVWLHLMGSGSLQESDNIQSGAVPQIRTVRLITTNKTMAASEINALA